MYFYSYIQKKNKKKQNKYEKHADIANTNLPQERLRIFMIVVNLYEVNIYVRFWMQNKVFDK